MISPQTIARNLGGEVSGDQVLVPGPGHSACDRSLSIKIDPDAPDGFTAHSFSGDDWRDCRDHVKAKMGMPGYQNPDNSPHKFFHKSEQAEDSSPPDNEPDEFASSAGPTEYIYRDEDGQPVQKVIRIGGAAGKRFIQSAWNDGAWIGGKGCMEGVRRVPYALPEMIKAVHDTVLIVEGEKDADNLLKAGFIATTNPQGAGKWTSDLNKWFEGKTVHILPDNDEPGRAHAQKVATELHSLARAVRIVELDGLPPKGDVSDWLEADPGRSASLVDTCLAAPEWTPEAEAVSSEPPLEAICAASFAGKPKPEREYLVPCLIPMRQVTMLSGDGGTGKSLLGLQLMASVASRALFLGLETRKGSVLYFSAEDDADECHIRLAEICEGEDIDLANLSDLHIINLAGEDALLAVEDGKVGRMLETPLYRRLRASIELYRPTLLTLDNVADIFGGNENVKGLVRQFIGMLRKLSIDFDCAVMVLAHPSLSGMASGTGMSGNVAWNNSVRSRLYLKRQHDDVKEITDPDYRRLVTMKSNYGPVGGEIGMRWEAGRFVTTDRPAAATSSFDRVAISSKSERIFLALVQRFNDEGRPISPSTSANYAPFVFAKHPQSEGVTKRQFEVAMDTLFAANRIKVVEAGPPSKLRKNIEICEVTNDE